MLNALKFKWDDGWSIVPAALKKEAIQRVKKSLQDVYKHADNGMYPFLSLPFQRQKNLEIIFQLVKRFRNDYKHILILGMGGATLSAHVLQSIKKNLSFQHKEHDDHCVQLHFYDQSDAATFYQTLGTLPWDQLGIIVISKSGQTPETLLQLMHCIDYGYHKKPEQSPARYIAVVTEASQDNPLLTLAHKMSLAICHHPMELGGRFSCFSVVGMIPALLLGLDYKAFLQGACAVVEGFFRHQWIAPVESIALKFAFETMVQQPVNYIYMLYDDAFRAWGLWYRQLWAESLGKSHYGGLPIIDYYPRDQHSVLQMYLGGSGNRFFTFVTGQKPTHTSFIKHDTWHQYPLLKNFSKLTLHQLYMAQAYNTARHLRNMKRPVSWMTVTSACESAWGALMMHNMIEVILMAEILNINPLGQPDIENTKITLKDYLDHEEN